MLISSGSRLDQDLLLSFSDDSDIERAMTIFKKTPELSEFQIRSYSERSEQTFDVTRELSNYILLILVVAAIFAGIILRSAHESLLADLSNTLRIVEILGFARWRQMIIFALLYGLIIPVAFALAIALAYGIILSISSIPAASEFVFLLSPITFAIEIIALLIVTSFAPLWIERLGIGSTLYDKIPKKISEPLSKYLSISGVILFI
jgi:ABC-type lipoprotein release transport system permease subunit